MRVVIDTNVVASAIFFGGKPEEVIDYVMTNRIDAYASAEFLEILKNDLKPCFAG